MKMRRLILFSLGASSIAALGAAIAFDVTPRLVWNASASAPIGLYRIETRSPNIGEFVLVAPDVRLKAFIEERGYLPPEIPLLKRVAALPGARICRENFAVLMDKIHVADALIVDSRNREMPVWSGCYSLKSGEIFLLNDHKKSLDGRYFGATQASQIIGVAIPIFVDGAGPDDFAG